MIHGFREEKRAKGQNMVEYALMLAIVVGIGWGIYDQVGLSGSIKGVFSDAGSLLEDASKAEKSGFDIQPSIDKLKELINNDTYNLGNSSMSAKDQNTSRGILMDFWLNDTDKKDADIAKLTSELGAKQWTYYHGKGPKYDIGSISRDSVGLYWSTDDLSNAQLTTTSDKNYSNESVLSYYYNGSNYYVVKNRVWMDQKPYNNNQPGLASKGSEYGKPEAEIVGNAKGYSTYAEAQQAYKDAFSKNNGSFIFTNQ